MSAQMIRLALAAAVLIAATVAHAQLSMMGIGPGSSGGAAAVCSPGSATGEVDLSLCSNAFYVAIIF